MNEHSIVQRRVTYQTSAVDGGVGVVVSHVVETGRVVVIDEDDATRWVGHEDHVALLES